MRHLVALATLGLGACAGPLSALQHRTSFTTEVGRFDIDYARGGEASAASIRGAVMRAGPKLAYWGGLREPVAIRVLATHRLLEEAVNRPGYPWLRAWARYDEVFVQAPRTWTLFGASQAEVDELMLHELTHCVMYQLAATRTGWTRKEIPLWFREGMASVTANQEYRWPALEELARYYEKNPGTDPVGDPESLYQGQSDIVYGAAHHTFAFLVRRYGDAAVREVLRRMQEGAAFPEAFEQSVGLSAQTFIDDFRRFVRLRGFHQRRRQRVPHPATPVSETTSPSTL
ncbi:MAG: peptidase MA family metallohydrolase [Myxococcota bacterium]